MSNMIATSEDIQALSSRLESEASSLQSLFSNASNHMQQAAAIWSSPAASTLNARFEALVPQFSQYVSLVDSFAQYLSATAMAYAENEEALSALAAR